MRHYLVLFLIFFLTGNLLAQNTLTLDEAIKIALQQNTILQRSENEIAGYESTVKSAYGSLLPTLNTSAGWEWNRNESKIEQTAVIQGGGTITIPGQTVDSRSYGISANSSITLFDGLSNFANISRSKNNLDAAHLQLQRVKQDIVFGTISRYHDVLNAKQLVQVRKDDLEYNQKNLEIINERNKLGAVTLADVYAQQVRVGNAELALIQAQNDFDNLTSIFLDFLGMNIIQEIQLVDPLETENTGIIEGEKLLQEYDNLSELVETALRNRYDFASQKLFVESAYNNITIQKGNYFPSITNNYSFSMGANQLENVDKNRNYSVGLSFFWPIFSGWQTENSVQLAKVQAKNAEVSLVELERDIKINLKNTYLNFQAAQKRLDVSEQNVLSAQQNRQIEEEKYKLGSSSLVNLLLASSEYTLALQNNINAKFDFLTLKGQLEYYLGVLDYKKYE